MIGCAFCEKYLLFAQEDFLRDLDYKEKGEYPPRHEMTVNLVHKVWTKGDKYHAKKTIDHKNYANYGYELNYCPTCGRDFSLWEGTMHL